MPPSPAPKISPGKEMRADKRGRSIDGGIAIHDREDDLILFNQVKNKEKENFLLQSNDDFDDLLSTKLKQFSDSKAGVSRGETSDLLNEGDKNDYDWLITPPESPLFASLDDEAPAFRQLQRGRPRSQPVPISRPSSLVERGYRSARGSPSPNRLSPSPRSGNVALQPRTRPVSASQSSPPHASPLRRSSPPVSSGVPIPRRLSTGSVSANHSKTRGGGGGVSPIRISSVSNSASPKIKAWQSSIPGFSCEVPPNLRTSLADRPASYVRGSSPASRNGSRSGRQSSMSPTASRSVSSSQSHERDPLRGSVASSGDDDVDDSLPCSNPAIGSVPINIVALANDHRLSKKPARGFSSSAPKRRYDLALRQMDSSSKGPQNMFRPLLSSVPSSTFYAGKGSTRNSSITTSSNTSSDQGTSGALDIEGQQNPEDASSELLGKLHPLVDDDDVFVVDDRVDVSDHDDDDDDDPPSATECPPSGGDISESEVCCSKCRQRFPSVELITEGDQLLCHKCKSSEVIDGGTEADHRIDQVQDPCDGELVPNVDIQEGKGISLLLLKRSSSAQGCIVPSRSYTGSNTSYDDFSYSRSSISMSSSLDLGRQTARNRRQPSGSKSDVENYGYANYERCSGSSTSGASGNVMSGSLEDGFRVTTAGGAASAVKDIRVQDQSLNSEAESTCTDVGSGPICKTAADEPLPLEEATMPSIQGEDHPRAVDEEGDYRIAEEPDVSAIPSKSRTLEDATDVILLCSSIVHEIAYNAANIAMNRESSPAGGVPRTPAAAALFPSPRTTSSGRRGKKTRPRKSVVAESKSPQSVLGENKEAGRRMSSSPPRIVGSATTVIPPKLESKCNCSIM